MHMYLNRKNVYYIIYVDDVMSSLCYASHMWNILEISTCTWTFVILLIITNFHIQYFYRLVNLVVIRYILRETIVYLEKYNCEQIIKCQGDKDYWLSW